MATEPDRMDSLIYNDRPESLQSLDDLKSEYMLDVAHSLAWHVIRRK